MPIPGIHRVSDNNEANHVPKWNPGLRTRHLLYFTESQFSGETPIVSFEVSHQGFLLIGYYELPAENRNSALWRMWA